ncbi:hypothetical protein VNO80_01265 [Phaseolus coccineus]|uniref:Uncharacterized protein n=1 Tax=Phaseolus coccineus TaxID=3886 RepID=A0AAN9RSK6_PHACN
MAPLLSHGYLLTYAILSYLSVPLSLDTIIAKVESIMLKSILVPDLFCGKPWTKDRQNLGNIAEDISRWTKWLVDEFMAAGISKKLGIIGFYFGGGKVLKVVAQDQVLV